MMDHARFRPYPRICIGLNSLCYATTELDVTLERRRIVVKSYSARMNRIPPDSDLIKRAQDGDSEAFGALFQKHRPQIYLVCLRMTGNTAEAEDLTQDAFLQVFRKIAAFRGESAFGTWLHRIAVNTVLMHFRKKPRGQVSLDEPYESDSPKLRHEYGIRDRCLVGCIDRIALARAVEQLPPGYRTIFLLHEVEGYEHQEIAEMLSCTVGNSKSQLHKAKQRFRELLTHSPEAQSSVQSGGACHNKRAIPKPKDWSLRIGKESMNATNSTRAPIEKANSVTGLRPSDLAA